MRVEAHGGEQIASPPETPEFASIRTGVQSLLCVLGRKRGERWLRRWVYLLESENSITPIRKASRTDGEGSAAALAWLRHAMPSMIAALPPDTD